MLDFKVIRCTSEDALAPASGLERGAGWATAVPTKKAEIDLLLTHKAIIQNFEICNNGAAFLEVCVGRDSLDTPKTLIPASSLMTMADVRDGLNRNRVRQFDVAKIGKKITAEDSWNFVRITLAQPFQPTGTLGLAWVRITEKTVGPILPTPSPAAPITMDAPLTSTMPLTLSVPDFEEDDNMLPPPIITPCQSKVAAVKAIAPTPAPRPGPIECGLDHSTPSAPLPSTAQKDAKPAAMGLKNTPSKITKEKTSVISPPPTKKEVPPKKEVPSKKPPPPPKKKEDESTLLPPSLGRVLSEHPAKALGLHPLSGVVIVLSGFQNPKRGHLRDAALKLGAGYSNDWKDDGSCTHLICAFANTPKRKEVEQQGRPAFIVRQSWLEQCTKEGRRVEELGHAWEGGMVLSATKEKGAGKGVPPSADSGSDTEEYEEKPPTTPVPASVPAPVLPPGGPPAGGVTEPPEGWIVHDVARLVEGIVTKAQVVRAFSIMRKLYTAGVPPDDLTMAFHDEYWDSLKVSGCGVPAFVKRSGRVAKASRASWLEQTEQGYLLAFTAHHGKRPRDEAERDPSSEPTVSMTESDEARAKKKVALALNATSGMQEDDLLPPNFLHGWRVRIDSTVGSPSLVQSLKRLVMAYHGEVVDGERSQQAATHRIIMGGEGDDASPGDTPQGEVVMTAEQFRAHVRAELAKKGT